MIRVSFANGNFVCKLPFESRGVAQKAGFRFDAKTRVFYTPNPRVAVRLREYADESAERKLKRTFLSVTPWPGRDSFVIPSILTPFEFQRRAAFFALSRNRSYLGLDPGLGKTIVAALVARALTGTPIVYLCPPFLMLNVEDEFRKLTTRQVLLYPDFGAEADQILIVPDSKLTRKKLQRIIQRFAGLFGKEPLLIVDEAHRFNHEDAQRTRALFGKIAAHFERQIWMSGTPMNRPIELYPVLSNAAPETIEFMTKFEYARKFCGAHQTPFGWDMKGASNMKKLAAQVLVPYSLYREKGETAATRKVFMLRVKKSVLGRKPVREELVFIGDNLPPKIARMEAEILKEYSPKDLMKMAIAKGDEPLHVSTYRRELGLLKIKPALPFIRSILDDTDEAMILVAIHREVIAELTDRLGKYRPFVIDGSVPQAKRVPIAKEFQTSKSRNLIIINPRAGGIGLNLQRADRVVFFEFDWVDNVNRQGIDRTDRIGRVGDVLAQYLIYKNSIDRPVMEENFKKRRVSNFV